ncbi:MAG: NAD(P)/FAD-dependent oxidoreductase [Desulfobacterales bacterium]|nr:MAG: NAD(P)/FAD-dependent oxidoreductase [Desulfobacterales bacterium]
MTDNTWDLLVVGGGPGGYTAAIRGSQRGLKTLLVERDLLGGTCLNRGCVPTKTLLEDSLLIAAVRTCYFMRGDAQISLRRLRDRKNNLAENSRAGIRNVLAENGVNILAGEAAFKDPRTMTVTTAEGQADVTAAHIVIATGAQAHYGSDLAVDGRHILSTEDALNPESIPRRLAVVGAGNRGVEFASLYHNLGSQVVLIEKEKRILPRMHRELAGRYKKRLVDRKIEVLNRTTVLGACPGEAGGVRLTLEDDQGCRETRVDRVLLTGTRQPAYQGLNLPVAGLSPEDGRLTHGPGLQTSQKGIYVVGDAAGPPYLAHKAIAQGLAAVDHILGRNTAHRPFLIANCVYGDPELACIGLSEEEALETGHRVRVGEFHFVGNGRAGSMGQADGVVRVVSDAVRGEVLGVHMLGPRVTELISLASLAMQNGIDVAGIKKTIFPHPALAETFFEAALATDGEAIHLRVEKEELDPE